MALAKTRLRDVPSDAIILSEEEALKYQLTILKKWKNNSEVFAWKYGAMALCGASFLTGFYLNNYYRRKFRLLHYGRLSTYIPICVIPAITSFMAHTQFVTVDLVLQKTECPVCVEMRASSLQATLGAFLPIVMGPVSAIMMALNYNTYDVPYLNREPRKVFELWRSKTKPIANILFAIFVGHALLASVITHFEAKSIITVNSKLAEIEQRLSDSGEYEPFPSV